MTRAGASQVRFGHHAAVLRDPEQIVAHWEPAGEVSTADLRAQVRGDWWGTLERLDITVLVTREYEHLVVAMSAQGGTARTSFMALPHPSGIAVDGSVVHIAATRNPNQIFSLAPLVGVETRRDLPAPQIADRPLMPVSTRFLAGSTYIHDLAMIGGKLHANAVGSNAIIRIDDDAVRRVWWPRSVETPDGSGFARNHLQLNSIAAGAGVDSSYYSASTATIGRRRPGDQDFPVDGRGVIFDGATREPMATGLTRPHSARLHGDDVWVDNSGYGEVGRIADGRLDVVTRLPGWTRGLAFAEDVALVGTSRVIPRFRQYAPGLDVDRSRCGVHAVSTVTGEILGSVFWPRGNQIFAIATIPTSITLGLPFTGRRRGRTEQARRMFYTYRTSPDQSE